MRKFAIYILAILSLTGCQQGQKPVDRPADKTSEAVVKGDTTDSAKDLQNDSVVAFKTVTKTSLENSQTIHKRFDGKGNDTLTLGSARLCVPAEGMTKEMVLSITPLDSAQLPKLPAGMKNVTTKGGGYRFLPHGEHFKRYAKVVLPYDSVRIPKGYTTKDIRTYYYDEQSGQWVVLPKDSINKEEQLASALTTHFTDMINGIITVPETPEAQGFAPTAMTDIKAADPSAGIMPVQAPSPNNNGTANIQIPFNFPAGRAGMGPNISVSYSNEGGSSWCGYGWNVNTPSISIDTRWGVPRYDSNLETESYLYNGEQFTDRAYRNVNMQRKSDKRFYLRRETDFSEIVRKGDSPTNYKWEVKKYDGTTDIYEAIETDSKGNIAKWGLKKTTDAHGNCVTYEYELENGTAFVSSINYTGYNGEPGAYSIKLNRKTGRPDITSSGRNGFLQIDNQQLTSIEVLLKGDVVRNYMFNYTEGRFGKTLLTAVAETDGKGNELYRNSFKYYDKLKKDSLFEKNAEKYVIDKSILRKIFDTVDPDFEGSPSLISGASSKGYSTQGGLNLGVGAAVAVPFAGGSYSYNKSESNGEITLTDIDGDGLSDIVYSSGFPKRVVYYKKNLSSIKGKLDFSDNILVTGISSFSNSVDEGHSTGFETGVSIGETGPNFSTSYSTSYDDNRTRIYFGDFNGDGIIDVADKGTVKFGHIGDDGIPVFEDHSGNTPNPIPGTGQQSVDVFVGDTTNVRDSLERIFPLLDVVRVWRAPFDGDITITSTAKVCDSTTDGVKYALQINSSVEKKGSLKAGESIDIGGKYKVLAGDLVMFRLQSNYSGTNDDVDWAPVIVYDSLYNKTTVINENQVNLTYYSAKEDFIPLSQPFVVVGGPSMVSVSSKLYKEKLSEDVVLKFYRDGVLVYRDTLKAEDKISSNNDVIFTEQIVGKDSILYSFEIESTTQIDHRKLLWEPIVERDRTVTNNNVVHETNRVVPERNYFNKIIHLENPVILSFDTSKVIRYKNDSLTITTHFEPNIEGVNLSVKNLEGGLISNDSLQLVDAINGKSAFVSFYSFYELDKIDSAYIAFHRTRIDSVYNKIDSTWTYTEVDTVVKKVNASVYSKFGNSMLGLFYNGWGQFAINGSESDAAIDIVKLNNSLHQFDNVKLEGDAVVGSPMIKENEKYLHTMLYNVNEEKYSTTAVNAYISATRGCPSRMGSAEIEVDVPKFIPKPNSVMAPYQHQHTDSYSVNTGGGASSVGVSASVSNSTSYTESSVMDLNGDRYPDWVSGNDGHFTSLYTAANGAMGTNLKTIYNGQGKQTSLAWSVGVSSSGGSDVKATPQPSSSSGETKKKRIQVCQESHQTGFSYGASGNYSKSKGDSEREWMDMNGDGLPDIVFNGGEVCYNTGYGFTPKIAVPDLYAVNKTESDQGGAGLNLGVDLGGHANISFGANYTNTKTLTNLQMIDLNGDGLPDQILYDNGLKAKFFTGSGFQNEVDVAGIHSNRSKSVGMGMHANVGVPVSIYIMMFKFKITPYFNYSDNDCVSKTTSTLLDMNGDGLPDLVTSPNDNEINVFYNRTGRTNMLDTVVMAGDAKMALQYELTKNSYEMPNRKYVLSGVEVIGGNKENGATRMRSTFSYEGGIYDRYEREFLGFSKVITNQHDTENDDTVYRSNELTFSNKRIIEKGLLLADSTFDAEGNLLGATNNTYKSVATNGSEFLSLVQTKKESFTEGGSVVVFEDYTYDEIGNVVNYKSTASDVVSVKVQYCNDSYFRRIPVKVNISGGATRERSCKVNDKGDITEIRMENGDKPSIFNFEYDQYGNITKVTRPANEQGDRFWNKLTYDDVLHSLVVGIENAYGYSSSSEYDYRFGVPTKTTDINGQSITYEFDNFGRMTKVKAPYEDDYTIKFSYNPSEKTAKTFHYTLEGDIVTTTTSDDLMRPIKVEKTAVVDGSLGTVATGIVTYDAFGRTVREALPTLNDGQTAGFSETRYDAHDRKVEVILPDGSSTKMAYEVVNNGLKTTVTDAEGHVSEQYTDARQRTVKTVRKGDSEDIIVEYEFNPLGELLTVTHPNQTQTKYTYDLLGNKLSVDNPDAGLTKFTYDAVGNLVTKQTPNLSKISNGGYIKYIYDFERLSEVQYPVYVTNRIQYTYGEHDDKNNCAGRIKLVQDASGGTEFTYGKLGEIIKTTRSVMLSTADVRTYVSESEYDSWNRIRKMKYPDGETVTYGYDAAGQLISMESEKDNIRYKLIEDMQYDQYGNVTYKKYGNGTESYYTYDPMRQRLATMTALSKGNAFMDAKYSYDKIDNILGIENDVNQMGVLGGSYSHTYNYDAFSRLVSASGNCSKGVTYDLKMQYDIMSNPLRKTQKVTGSIVASSHDLEYTYGGSKPNAVQKVGNEAYTYDMNGNPTLIEGDTTYREMVWNEENRLMMLADEDYVSRYTYDYTGNRVIKSHGPMTTIYINGALQGVDFHDDENYTLYVSPFMTVNSDRFTKYYYAGTQRIASKIGSGKFDNVYGVNGFHLTAGQMDYAERAVEMIDGIKEFYKQSGVTPGVPNQLGQNANPYVSGVAYPSVPLGDYSVPAGWPGAVEKHGPGEVMGPPVWFKEEELPEAEAGVGFKSDYQRENDMFFFHTDHLGSTSYLTDTAGNVSQFVWYAPYGEALVDEHTAHYENPLKFSGKELDEITGLYDHGARNRNPITTLWYGIDPLWEKYPGFSPYNYCAGNPVKLVDPDGRRLFVKAQSSSAIIQASYLYIHIKKVAQRGNGSRLKISRNQRTGEVNCDFTPGRFFWQKKIHGYGKIIYNIIKNQEYTVNLIACEINGVTPPLGDNNQPKKMYAGAFGGNHAEGNVQVAEQYLCIDQLNELDTYSNKPGTSVMHEMTEAFNGAKHAKEEGRNYGPAYSETDPDYLKAHNDPNTIKQPPIERFENEDGSVNFKTYEIKYLQGPNNTEIEYRMYHDLNY